MAIEMGQTPKRLVPARSVLDYAGARVRAMRIARGLSQAVLGALVFAHRDLVRKIETAERIPSGEFLGRCDEALEARGALALLIPLVERERLLRSARTDTTSPSAFQSGATDRPVLDWLLTESADRQPATDDDTVVDAAARLDRLRNRGPRPWRRHGLSGVADALRGRLAGLAATAPQIATGMLELAGYEAVDLGVDGLAQRHYLHALELMTRTGNRVYGGYLVAVSLAHLALHCGDAEQALRLATAGLRDTERQATPAVRAAFRTVQARAHARRRDEAACARCAAVRRSRPRP
ncbi:helix-turn-helix transcriptional regulator [Dactylosporangium darangshiense]